MKKGLHIICLMCLITLAKAQPYGNEWIDYSKTYYKFKIGKTSLYRINFSTLVSLGIPVDQLRGTAFKLIRNGNEVPLYVTTNNQFATGDFIEFYAEKNDGKPDSVLYKTPDHQPYNKNSLFSDTATFFLTLDPFNINARVTQQINDLSFTPDAEKYCYYTISKYGNRLIRGLPISPYFSQLYNSDFDIGEGFYGGIIDFDIQFNEFPVNFLYKDSAVNAYFSPTFILPFGPHKVKTSIYGGAFDTIEVVDGPIVIKPTYPTKSTIYVNGEFPDIKFFELEPSQIQRDYLSVAQLEYPRIFNFNNQSKIDFGFKKKDNLYFEIRNFNPQSTTPILYDLNNNHRYLGIVDTVIKFHLFETLKDKNNL